VLYYEAARILKHVQSQNVVHVHVSYLPTPPHLGEPKTKPTQLSVKTLNSMGIQPDFIVARAIKPMDDRRRERFSLFCSVKTDHIIDSPDLKSVYELPLLFANQNFDTKVLNILNMDHNNLDIAAWKQLVTNIYTPKTKSVTIAIVGKYFATGEYQLRDSYAALYDALDHAAIHHQITLNTIPINSEAETDIAAKLSGVDGLIVPIGWGERGVEGKINAIRYAREHKLPFLGLCYGMQLAVVEFARHVANLDGAHTTEVNPNTKHPVIHMIPDQERILESRAYGGTMRLGGWDCKIVPGTLADQSYARHEQYINPSERIASERHRHRYEFNNTYTETLTQAGLVISGRSIKENLVEVIELPQEDSPLFRRHSRTPGI
jgi:CTP synthase